jgi:hypothetical protein
VQKSPLLAAAAATLLLLLPSQSGAAQIPSQEVVIATVSTTFTPSQDLYTSVFDGSATGAGTSAGFSGGRANASGTVAFSGFHMSVSASPCCTVHAFVLGPWTGTWTLNGTNGDSLSGTAEGSIDAQCLSLGDSCDSPSLLGPSVSFTLTVTGGTGRYANATGSGSLTGEQTVQVVDLSPIPPAGFAGVLTLSV